MQFQEREGFRKWQGTTSKKGKDENVVSEFLQKLYEILETEDSRIVSWTSAQSGISIKNVEVF